MLKLEALDETIVVGGDGGEPKPVVIHLLSAQGAGWPADVAVHLTATGGFPPLATRVNTDAAGTFSAVIGSWHGAIVHPEQVTATDGSGDTVTVTPQHEDMAVTVPTLAKS